MKVRTSGHRSGAGRLIAGLAAAALLAGLTAGCGTPGLPRAPSLKLPLPVAGLTADRSGDTVLLSWMMPRQSTDRLALEGPVKGNVCRAAGSSKVCERVGEVSFAPGVQASFEDHLPAELAAGAPELLSYSVELLSPSGHSAGVSNAAYSASGFAPAPVVSFAGTIRSDGVLLRWQSAGRPASWQDAAASVGIERRLLSVPGGGTPGESANAPARAAARGRDRFQQLAAKPEETVLSVAEDFRGSEPGPASGEARTLDAEAEFDRVYSYQARRIVRFVVEGHAVTVAGAASGIITVNTRDVFPPAVPSGLVSLNVPEERAIDLSWSPDTERDLAGYVVYRRLRGEEKPERISAELVVAPSFRDAKAAPGRVYLYSVSAVDLDGNESGRSAEVEEGLPAK
ncbi:MAG TPA: hypothetical protein VGD59_00785 [Acidisarcina sp.]